MRKGRPEPARRKGKDMQRTGLAVTMLAAAAVSCRCAGGPAAEAAFRAADAIVVWNPGTGINEAGRKLTKAALADLTNALAKVTGTVPAVYAEGEEPPGAKAAIYLGDTKAARMAGCTDANLRRGDWRILNVPGRAYVFAKAGMGAAYAMSDFVERYLGYWFLTPEGDDPYDHNPERRIPLADVTVKPAIYNARIYTANPWYNSFARRRRAPSAGARFPGTPSAAPRRRVPARTPACGRPRPRREAAA